MGDNAQHLKTDWLYMLKQILVILTVTWPIVICWGVAVLAYILGFPRWMLVVQSFLFIFIGVIFGHVWNEYLDLSKKKKKIFDFFRMASWDRKY
jgi:hypothetical protein